MGRLGSSASPQVSNPVDSSLTNGSTSGTGGVRGRINLHVTPRRRIVFSSTTRGTSASDHHTEGIVLPLDHGVYCR